MKHTIQYLQQKLLKSTGSPNPNLIHRLGKLAHPDATDILLEMLSRPNIGNETQQYVLVALRYTDDPRARDAVLHYFQNGFDTSTVVINSVGILRETRAVPRLIEILEHGSSSMRDLPSTLSLKFRATIALGNIGDERAIPVLCERLNDYKLVLRYALSDVQLQVPLCEYAYEALVKIGSREARLIAEQWKLDYDEQLRAEARVFLDKIKSEQACDNLQGELIRLKQYALVILEHMSKPQLLANPFITFNVLKELAKQSNRMQPEAKQQAADFIMWCMETHQPHLTLEQGFMLLDHYDDARSIEFALKTFAKPDFHSDIHGDPLAFLTKKQVIKVVPIIERKIRSEGVSERYLTCLGAIGGVEAERIVMSYLDHNQSDIQLSAIYALADLARSSDTALEAMSQLIDSQDYNVSQQAIIRMDKVGSRAVFILLNMLRNYDKWSSTRALATLARIGDTCIVPHLIDMLSDPEYQYLHREIVNTLEKLGGEDAYAVVNAWRGE